jgi:hypothetical protein
MRWSTTPCWRTSSFPCWRNHPRPPAGEPQRIGQDRRAHPCFARRPSSRTSLRSAALSPSRALRPARSSSRGWHSCAVGRPVWTCTGSAGPPALAGDWIADAKTGCRVFNPNPTARGSVSWSGSCKGGLAEATGVVHWFREGLPFERDEGPVAGRAPGRCPANLADRRYEGEVRDGMPHGHGRLIVR